MQPRTVVPDALSLLAGEQGGVITTAQALACGLTARSVEGLLGRGTWTRLATGVMATRHSDRDWTDLMWAGLLLAGDGAALGGAAAAHLHGFAEQEQPIDIWIPGGRRVSRPQPADESGPWRFRRGDRHSFGSPPRISVEEAVLDLCAGKDADEQSHWLGLVISERRTTRERLEAALSRATRLAGRQQITELVAVVAGGSHSPLETRYLRDVAMAHGLPPGTRQRSVSGGTRSDMVYDDYNTIVELDGWLGHRGPGERRDAWRDARHLAKGLGTLRFGWADIFSRPCQVAEAVATVLAYNGWPGEMQQCRRCPAVTVVA